MASSSKAKGSLGPRFYDYLDGLREEFESATTSSTTPRRFHVYLEGLKCEFELLSEKVERLQRERESEYVEMQMKKCQGVGPNLVCERCCTDAFQTAVTPKSRATTSLFSTRFFQSKSHSSRGVGLTRKATTLHSTQRIPLLQKLHSIITPIRPSQSIVGAIPKLSDTDFRTATLSSSPQQASASTVDLDPGSKELDCSIMFNNEVEKELDVEIAHILSHPALILCVKFSRDGTHLAAGCADGKAYIYDVRAGTLTRVLRNLLVKEDDIRAVCFSRNGKYLATGSWKGELYIWEINRKHVRNAFKGHTRFINSLDFSPNGRLLVSTSDDNTVRLWNMHDGATRFLTEENPTVPVNPAYTSAVFSPDGRYVAASHRDGMVKIWDVCTGHLTRRIKAHTDWVTCVAFVPDGKGLVSGDWEGKLSYWDVSSLDSTRFRGRSQRSRVEEQTCPEREFIGHEDFVYAVAISPDGRWVASSSYDLSARIWDIRNAAMQCVLKVNDPIFTVNFNPAGCYLASGGEGGTLTIWRYSDVASTGSRVHGRH